MVQLTAHRRERTFAISGADAYIHRATMEPATIGIQEKHRARTERNVRLWKKKPAGIMDIFIIGGRGKADRGRGKVIGSIAGADPNSDALLNQTCRTSVQLVRPLSPT